MSIVIVTMLPKAVYRLSAIPIILPAALVTELEPKIKAALGSWNSEGGQGSTRQRRAGMGRKCQVKGAGHEQFRKEWVETEGDTPLGRSQGRGALDEESITHDKKGQGQGDRKVYHKVIKSQAQLKALLLHWLGDPTKATSLSQVQDLQLSDRKENQHLVGSRGNRPQEKV